MPGVKTDPTARVELFDKGGFEGYVHRIHSFQSEKLDGSSIGEDASPFPQRDVHFYPAQANGGSLVTTPDTALGRDHTAISGQSEPDA